MSIIVKNAYFGYEKIVPIHDFSYKFGTGVYAITGASGCGKSTLLLGLSGLLSPISGSVIYSPGMRSAFVFQDNRLVPQYSAQKNLALISDDKDKATELLSMLSLADTDTLRVSEYSGGMQRRVAIARALLYGGDTVFLDEPFTGLDDALKITCAKLIKSSFKTIIISVHDLHEAQLLCDTGVAPIVIELRP